MSFSSSTHAATPPYSIFNPYIPIPTPIFLRLIPAEFVSHTPILSISTYTLSTTLFPCHHSKYPICMARTIYSDMENVGMSAWRAWFLMPFFVVDGGRAFLEFWRVKKSAKESLFTMPGSTRMTHWRHFKVTSTMMFFWGRGRRMIVEASGRRRNWGWRRM